MPGSDENSFTASSRSFEVNLIDIKFLWNKNSSIISCKPAGGIIFICDLFSILANMFSGK
jgi:hypothetical protein